MIAKSCGCSTETCGCCEGTERLTPMPTANPPGLDALRYRVGTHGSFLETMKADLATVAGLTTRDSSDPAIALLDGWATVGDVLTFYQERIANEGYLRTATERRSILELARLVGYRLRPGVSATAYLAYTVDEKQLDPVDIPVGARSQSIPGPDELPQSFETSEKLTARSVWNNLQVRLRRPQNITFGDGLTIKRIYVAGTTTNLKSGDSLLLRFGEKPSILRTVANVEAQFEKGLTVIQLRPVTKFLLDELELMKAFVKALGNLPGLANDNTEVLKRAERLLSGLYLGLEPSAADLSKELRRAPPALLEELVKRVDELASRPLTDAPSDGNPTDPATFVGDLLKPSIPQVRNSLQLGRGLARTFQRNADVHAQLLVNFAEKLKDTYYAAWSNAELETRAQDLQGVYALREVAPLFGANVPKQATYYEDDEEDTAGKMHRAGAIKPQSEWQEWDLQGEAESALFLDKAYEAIAPVSYVMIQQKLDNASPLEHVIGREIRQVTAVKTVQRAAYGQSGKATRLTFTGPWWDGTQDSMERLRATLVYGQSELLTLADEPMPSEEVSGSEIPLAALYNELTSGRWVIFSGERADILGVTGVRVSELLMIAGLTHGYDETLPGDKTRTTLILATPTAYRYKRETLTIYGNVVKATHGESRSETLGAGDASQALQAFALKQPPVTFVPAPNASGVDSTLKVYVNDVEWHEADTLAFLGPSDRKFVTKTEDDGKTTVVFGNGEKGARLPTGVENVRAVYRSGIGKPGNVRAEQISLLQTRPLGVKAVLNPLRTSGGADKEGRDLARENAPLAVMALDRLVSVQDYADFTRTFAGIGKARAQLMSDGHRELVHVTIAGADDIPIEPISDLYRNLVAALWQLGDPVFPVQVDSRELKVLVLSANIRLEPDYLWEPVVTRVRATLLDRFGFQKRGLGQPALLSEVIRLIQGVRGVAWVDVDAFGGIPEKKPAEQGGRRLLTQKEMADAVEAVVAASRPASRVEVNLADVENGTIRPAQLAIFTPSVPDTLILNQLL